MEACGMANLLLAGALDSRSRVIVMLLATGVFAYFAGQLFEPAFAEISQPGVQAVDSNSAYSSAQHVASGNSYYRSMTESFSVSTTQGKINSYSRSMSEQASLNTGMPPSASTGQQLRV